MKGKISLLVIGSMAVTLLNAGIAGAATTSLGYTDVSGTDPHYKAIEWLSLNGVIKGYGDNTFRPNNPVNRAEMLKMIFIADGNEDDADAALAGAQMFPDTPKTEWYAKYVALARQRGTVQGYPDGKFRPANNINKAEAYKIVLKEFYNESTMSYAVSRGGIPASGSIAPDVKKTDWFVAYVNFAAIKNIYDAYNLTSGNKSAVLFYPGNNLTRGELAELIYRAKAVSDNFPNNIEDPTSVFASNTIPFSVNLYAYSYLESSGKPTFTILDATHPNALFGYATKYPQSLLISNGDTPNMLKFLSSLDQKVLDISISIKENPDRLSMEKFFGASPTTDPYKLSNGIDNLLINTQPSVWFHKVNQVGTSVDEVVAVQFQNAIAVITDHGSKHQADGIFNYIVHNFWFKNFGI